MLHKKLLPLLVLITTNSVLANDFYLGADIGISQYSDIDSIGGTYGINAGYYFLNLDTIQASVELAGKNIKSLDIDNNKRDINSYAASLKVSLVDIGPVDFYGRFGVHRWTLDEAIANMDKKDTDLIWGIGFNMPIASNMLLNVEYQSLSFNPSDISYLGAGVQFLF